MTNEPLKIAVLGAGRMGRQVVRVIDEAGDCQVAGIWSRSAGTELATLLAGADVAVDFTLPELTQKIVDTAVDLRTPLVCGVTGLDPAIADSFSIAARKIPLLYDRNMSPGIAVVSHLVRLAVSCLGQEVQTEIHETHHVHKKDAPSGTALELREVLGDNSINIHSRREGAVIGNHRVRFTAANEAIEIAHSVSDRRVFADGAIVAARWLAGKAPGLYRMADIWSFR